MSWSFNIARAADKAEAKAKVAGEKAKYPDHFPDAARAIVDAAIDALPECENSVINVSSNGHFAAGENRSTSSMTVNVSNAFADA